MAKFAELKVQTKQELETTLEQLRREQFKLRIKRDNDGLTTVHRFKEVRRDIARVLTLLASIQSSSNN